MKCKDCKYWKQNTARWGTCDRINELCMIDIVTSPEMSLDYLIDTHSNFGCTFGEREPITDTDELVERLR